MKVSELNKECYHVFYTKDIHKKKKVFKQGVLVLSINNMAKLFDEDGQMVISFKNKEQVEVDEEYVIQNTYLITIDKIGSIEEYNTGAIFTKKQMVVLPMKKKVNEGLNNNKDSKNIQLVHLDCGLDIERKLFQILRPHQKQGVGLKNNALQGCILADYMGLGKTLQTLALTYSMIKQKDIKKFLIVCPLTLLDVWQKQTKKWLCDKLIPLVCFGDGAQTTNTVKKFIDYEYRMLIISYQCFYKNIQKLSGKCDLVIFDEGHRIKNKKSKLLLKLKVFRCQKRILLTGTPIQNNLQQLYTCISIINPRMFGNQAIFKNVFQKPIVQGLGKRATQLQKQLAKERTSQLARQLKQFSLRRTADVLKKFLPPKYEHLIFLKLTPLQKLWYERILELKNQVQQDMFRTLNYLRKLFIHPSIFKMKKIKNGDFQICSQDSKSQRSFKIEFTERIIASCQQKNQKCVVVSYFTQTLDFIGAKLKERGINSVKLDGRQSTSQRKHSLIKFQNQINVLLLSGKAGGTGLTLICAAKMIMLEPDWNPSNDSQVMGRIWRQGQDKEVHIYRFIIASTFEQRILQRQGLKKTLANNLIDDGKISQEENEVDIQNMSKLFVENKGQVLTFKIQQNQLEDFKSKNEEIIKNKKKNEDIDLEKGIIFVKTNCSSNNQVNRIKQIKIQSQNNQFQNLGLINFANKSKNNKIKKQNNSHQQVNQEESEIHFQEDSEQQNDKFDEILKKTPKDFMIDDKNQDQQLKLFEKPMNLMSKPLLKDSPYSNIKFEEENENQTKSQQVATVDLVRYERDKEQNLEQDENQMVVKKRNEKTDITQLHKGPKNLLKKIVKK